MGKKAIEIRRLGRAIAFDMCGYGRSDPARGPVVRRDEIDALLKHLGIPKAVLIGCSMGGANVLDFDPYSTFSNTNTGILRVVFFSYSAKRGAIWTIF